MKHVTLTAAAAGILCCGAAPSGQTGQVHPGDSRPDVGRPAERQPQQRPLIAQLVSYTTLIDAQVVSGHDRDRTGEVDHLVIDTGGGRAAYALIDTNGILQSEDRVVAVPYGVLAWNPAQKWFMLDAGESQLNGLPEVDADDLSRFNDPRWLAALHDVFSDRPDLVHVEPAKGDEYTPHFRESQTHILNGRILVQRDAQTTKDAECLTIVLRDDRTDREYTVLLAPEAHLRRHDVALKDGDVVAVSVVGARGPEGAPISIARALQVDGRAVLLRDVSGVPAWDAASHPRASTGRFRLASDVRGSAVHARDEGFGTVNDIVLEAHSGALVFAVISVGGVLGIGDSLYAIPGRALTFRSDDTLFVDMPVAHLKGAPKLSDEGIKDLDNAEFRRQVHAFYETQPDWFDADRPIRQSPSIPPSPRE